MRTNHNASGKPSLEDCAGLRYLPSVGIASHIPLGVWYFDNNIQILLQITAFGHANKTFVFKVF